MSQELLEGVNATRMELLALKERLNLAKRGYELLKEKLEALTNELFEVIKRYKEVAKQGKEAMSRVQENLRAVYMSMGPLKTQMVAQAMPERFEIVPRTRNLMGVTVPILELHEIPLPEGALPYSPITTTAELDEAVENFKNSLKVLIQLAQVQSALTRLAQEITETKRRVNSLNYIIIPRIENTIQWIRLTLSEREREEFVRLKKVKAKIQRE